MITEPAFRRGRSLRELHRDRADDIAKSGAHTLPELISREVGLTMKDF